MAEQILKRLPPSETLWLTVLSQSGDVFYITSKQTRDVYYIYQQHQNGVLRMGKGKSPDELEKKWVRHY